MIAYQLFVGCRPFAASTAQDMLTMHVHDAPMRPRLMWPEIPPRLEELLLAMLAKVPEERPSVQDVALRLGDVADELFRSCVPVVIDDRDADDRKTSGYAPTLPAMSSQPDLRRMDQSTKWLAMSAIVLAALVSTSMTTNIGASNVPARALPVPALAPPPVIPVPVPAPHTAPPPAPKIEVPTAQPSPQPIPQIEPQSSELQDRPSEIKPLPAARPARRRNKRAQLLAPVSVAGAVPAAVEPNSNNAVIVRYVALGRELAASKRVIDASDLWTKYRLVNVYEALRTEEQRVHAVVLLGEIQVELSKRVANAVASQ